MQLFVTEYKKNDTTIIITDSNLLSQLRKVLRASIGDIIWVQSPEPAVQKTRYEIRIEVWDNKMVEGTIVSTYHHTTTNAIKTMIVAMPNKWDKVELIVQKLTECGLDQIVFWPSERSIIREWNTKKEERLHKIIKEAVEQSRGRTMPELHFTRDITQYIQDTEVIVFDKSGTMTQKQEVKAHKPVPNSESHITGIVGPEGGFTPRDYQIFEGMKYEIYGLGTTVLRTETAAIIGGRIIKNNEKAIPHTQ